MRNSCQETYDLRNQEYPDKAEQEQFELNWDMICYAPIAFVQNVADAISKWDEQYGYE